MVKSSQRLRDIFWAFSFTRDSFMDGDFKNRSVILFTASARQTRENLSYWIRIKSIMQDMLDAGAVIVVPSGNYAQISNRSQSIDTIPAAWATPDFPLIVVGAVNDLRHRAPFSQGPQKVTVYAPGKDVECAGSPNSLKKASGTSYAAAMVGALSRANARN